VNVDPFISRLKYNVSSLHHFDSLLSTIDKNFLDEGQKVRAIYFRTTENTVYDDVGLYSGNIISSEEEALKKNDVFVQGILLFWTMLGPRQE
jgi:hypothetical protein